MCHCSHDVESISHFLFYCPTFTTERQILLSTRNDTAKKLFENTDSTLSNIFLFGDTFIFIFDRASNTQILNATIKHISSTKRFEKPLF